MIDVTGESSAAADNARGAWSRREFLRTSALGVATVGLGGLLSACMPSAGPSASAGGPPKRGGTLHLGATGGGSTDTLDPQAWLTNVDQLRVQQLFDPLVWMNNAGQAEFVLAKSITPNSDATEWLIEIHSGITTHRGKTFTADDVLYSLRRTVTGKLPGQLLLGPIDLANSKVIDATRVMVRFKQPFGALLDELTFPFFYMVPRGFDPARPDGTGPFKFQSFTPGVESTFVRNENYWQTGKPYLDKIVTTDVSDESTQVNGLQSGQFDVINALSASSIAALRSNPGTTVVVNKSGTWVPFTLNCASRPFSDVRVRQAMRLIIDRKQMREQVFSGYGSLGNDMFSPYDKGYPTDIPQREQDIDHAKSLLRSAGHRDLRLSLYTAPSVGGEVSIAEVFATQAKAAGVSLQLAQHTVGDFYTKYYQKVPLGMDWGTNQLYVPNAGQLMLGKQSPYNATHFDDAEYNAVYAKAIATADAAARHDLIAEMARIDHERGAYIVPVFSPVVEAHANRVGGIARSVTGVSPGNADFKNFWTE